MVTTGGLVQKGNPDKQVAANATRYHRHSVKELEALTPEGWEAYHAGYFNHIVNKNPNYILPLSFLRDLEGKGQIGRVHEWMYALPGVLDAGRHGARSSARASRRTSARAASRASSSSPPEGPAIVAAQRSRKEIERAGIPVGMISAIYSLR